METKGTAAAGKTKLAGEDMGSDKPQFTLQEDQLLQIAAQAGQAAAMAGAAAAAKFLESAKPELESRTEELAKKAVGEAMARKQKAGTMKAYGVQAAVSAAVFALGTATLVGIDKFRHRNDAKANAMNPQYTGSQT